MYTTYATCFARQNSFPHTVTVRNVLLYFEMGFEWAFSHQTNPINFAVYFL